MPVGGLQEFGEQLLPALGRRIEARPVFGDVLMSTPQNLPAVGFVLADGLRDLGVVVVENLAQQEDRALDRGEALQQHHEGHRERLVNL